MAKFATTCTFTHGKGMQGPNMMFGRSNARVGFRSKSLTSHMRRKFIISYSVMADDYAIRGIVIWKNGYFDN